MLPVGVLGAGTGSLIAGGMGATALGALVRAFFTGCGASGVG